jgi:hypothetical protein
MCYLHVVLLVFVKTARNTHKQGKLTFPYLHVNSVAIQ